MNKENKVLSQVLLSPLGMWATNEERPQQAVCFRAGHRTERLGLQ